MNFEKLINGIKFDDNALVPAIAQDIKTGEVLMMAYMNKESIIKTIETGNAVYWSRSRQKFWMKGESSGNVQKIEDICIDCDGDTLLLKIRQLGDNGASEYGASCHKGYRSCFFRTKKDDEWNITGEKLFNPEEVYKK
ncbi:phosphoribosyl-AMP cyclohydrolase [bacterium]